MSDALLRWAATGTAIGLAAILSYGCVVAEGGYGGGPAYGLDYYEPYGIYYGGWGPGYEVAPFRPGERHPEMHGGGPSPHAYRPAPASRAMPSIPTAPRPGGGGRGGGGGHR